MVEIRFREWTLGHCIHTFGHIAIMNVKSQDNVTQLPVPIDSLFPFEHFCCSSCMLHGHSGYLLSIERQQRHIYIYTTNHIFYHFFFLLSFNLAGRHSNYIPMCVVREWIQELKLDWRSKPIAMSYYDAMFAGGLANKCFQYIGFTY